MDLRDRVHRDADDDQQRGAAEIEREPAYGNQDFGQDADRGQIERADDRDARQDVVDVFGGLLARTDAGKEAAILAKIVRGLLRIDDDGRVEEGEENDQQRIDER